MAMPIRSKWITKIMIFLRKGLQMLKLIMSLLLPFTFAGYETSSVVQFRPELKHHLDATKFKADGFYVIFKGTK